MTTTGGRGDVDLDAPVVARAEGDDIVVLPDSAPSNARARLRTIVVGAIAIVLAAAGLTAALLSHYKAAPADSVKIAAHVPATVPGRRHPVARHIVPTTAAKTHVTVTPTSAVVVPTTAGKVAGGPPPVTPSSAPIVTAPPAEPASVLQWTSSPVALTIKAGGHVTFSVNVANPTAGNVTLGTPLACTPALQPKGGAPIGGLVCEQMAEVISPHQALTQQYTIYATDTGDATGKALPAGAYVARVENLFSIPVTISAK